MEDKHLTAGCGAPLDEVGGVPLRVEEPAAALSVVPQEVEVGGEGLVGTTEPVHPEAEVVEPGRGRRRRDRVHRRARVARDVHRHQRQAAQRLAPVVAGAGGRNRDPDVAQPARLVEHRHGQQRVRRGAEACPQRLRSLAGVLAHEQVPRRAARPRGRLLEDLGGVLPAVDHQLGFEEGLQARLGERLVHLLRGDRATVGNDPQPGTAVAKRLEHLQHIRVHRETRDPPVRRERHRRHRVADVEEHRSTSEVVHRRSSGVVVTRAGEPAMAKAPPTLR